MNHLKFQILLINALCVLIYYRNFFVVKVKLVCKRYKNDLMSFFFGKSSFVVQEIFRSFEKGSKFHFSTELVVILMEKMPATFINYSVKGKKLAAKF